MSLSVRDSYSGKNILVTGFTGFVGKVFVGMLLDQVPEIGSITLLVRGRRDRSAAGRVRDAFEASPALRPLREKHGNKLHAFLAKRVRVVHGDVCKPMLGIDRTQLRTLADDLDAIVHCAGLTNFSPDPINALSINTWGASHAADVAELTKSRRLFHVSTCFVAGMQSGAIAEDLEPGRSPNGTRFDIGAEILALRTACEAVSQRHSNPKLPAARAERIDIATQRARALGWPNLYTYTKGLAEHLLAERTALNLTVLRPSIVECARSYPFPGWNEGINTSGPIVWMCSGFAWKVPMRADNCFDVVPVDEVAKGMVVALAANLSDRGPSVVHLASGDQNPFTLGRALDLTALAVRTGYVPTGISAVERTFLTHMDSTAQERGADRTYLLSAARGATKWVKERLAKFDPDRHLPSAVSERDRDSLSRTLQSVDLRLNKTHMLLRSVETLWKSYQPFIHDYDYCFTTTAIQALSGELADGEREIFGWDIASVDWRRFWLDVEIPGLDKWSLPLIRGKEVPDDPTQSLGADIPEVVRRHESTRERARVSVGEAQ